MIMTLSLSPAVDKIYFIDGFKPGGLYRINDVVQSAGGKGINVARALSILGERVRTIGFKGGQTGEWLETQLKSLGVDTRFVPVSGESRTNSNIIDRDSGIETEILETGPFINQDNRCCFLEIFEKMLPAIDILVCSGGLPEGIPPDFYNSLITIAHRYGTKAVLDSSGVMLEEGIKAKPYMVKPNLRELAGYLGSALEDIDGIVKACRNIISTGVQVVCASLGDKGAVLVSGEMVLYSKGIELEAVNTIGSGDSMVAGLVAALSRGGTLEEAFRLGMACGAANTQFREIGVVSKDLVGRLGRQIGIKIMG